MTQHLFLITVLSSVTAAALSQSHSAEEEVWKVVETWNNAFAANDPERYFKFIHSDITLLLPGNPYRVEGIAQDKEEFLWSLKKGITKVEFFQEMQPKIQLIGNTAIVSYYTRGAYGEATKFSFLKETDVLVNEGGQWKIIHIHVSE